MNCRKTALAISMYIDGEITPQEKMQMDAHLGACATCRAKYERMLATGALISDASAGAATALPSFEARLRSRIAQQKEAASASLRDLIAVEKKLMFAFGAVLLIMSAVTMNSYLKDTTGTYSELRSYIMGTGTDSLASRLSSGQNTDADRMISYLLGDVS